MTTTPPRADDPGAVASPDPVSDIGADSTRGPWARALAVIGVWVAGTVTLWYWLAPKGYNTSDYGFIIGQSWRVLNGETPHGDFISARPAGSAVLHLIDFLLPLPLVEASRLVAVVLSVLVAVFAGVAVLGRLPWRWTPTGNVVVAVAALLTVNTFQVGPWYTTDGLVFVLGAAAALRLWEQRQGRLRVPAGALLAAGAAPLFKQSFFLAAPLVIAWVLLRMRQRHQLSWARAFAVVLITGVPGVLYTAWVATGSGLDEMLSQLSAATQPNWVGTIGDVGALTPRPLEAALTVATVLVVVAVWVVLDVRSGLRDDAEARRQTRALGVAAAAAYVALIAPTWAADLSMYEAGWSTRLFWLAVLATIVASVRSRRLRLGDLTVIAAAWMSVLSWGMPWPLLVGGALSLVVAQALAEPVGDPLVSSRGPREDGWVVRAAWLVAAVVALAGTGAVLRHSVENVVIHRDRPASQLTAALLPLDPDFGRTLTNPTTARFVSDAVTCLREHPADNVVFGSWNSDLYAVLGVRNPLATDGSNNFELTGAEEQYRDSVRALAARGDFLFLMPLVNPEAVHLLDELPQANAETQVPEYWFTEAVPYAWSVSVLGGEKVACGSWLGYWSPGAPSR